MYNRLFEPISICSKVVPNRIVLPPIVRFGWTGDDGLITQRHVNHYHEIAKGGAGLIIVESTAVRKDGRITATGPGIWDDHHIEAFRKLTDEITKTDSVCLLQINHAGLRTPAVISPLCKGPSAIPGDERSAELSPAEIVEIRENYISAGIRAFKAGFDGIEIHGAHGYLLNQFASTYFNRRNDQYGGNAENRLRLANEIITGIRNVCGKDFIIGYRLGVNSPSFQEGIENACLLEKFGINYVHVSHGGNMDQLPLVPVEFPYNGISYSSRLVKEKVSIPVIAVNNIRTPERAEFILENYWADMVAIGKDMLTDPHWANRAKEGKAINHCHLCQPSCHWYVNSDDCPGFAEWKE